LQRGSYDEKRLNTKYTLALKNDMQPLQNYITTTDPNETEISLYCIQFFAFLKNRNKFTTEIANLKRDSKVVGYTFNMHFKILLIRCNLNLKL
jgi:glutaredoxin 2